MSDDNNNDDDIEGKKLNPSLHDLINQPGMNGAIDNHLNPSLEDALYNDNVNPSIESGTNKNDSNPPKKKVYTISDNSDEGKIKTKYYALRIIANTLQILAFIVGIAGIGISIGVALTVSSRFNLFAIAGIIGSIVAFIVILAQAEIIKLFIDVEANARAIELNTRPKKSK